MIPIKQSSSDQRSLDETQIPALLVFQKLITKRLIAIDLGDNSPDLDAQLSAGIETATSVDQAIASTVQRPHEDRNTLAVFRDRRRQARDLDLKSIIKPTGGFDTVGIDLEHATAKTTALQSVRRIAQSLQWQAELRLSCHGVPTCAG